MSPTNRTNLHAMIEGALCIALAIILSFIKILKMPQGGSITLEMMPLLFFAYRQGFRWGIIAGTLFGFLLFLTGGYFVHPLQFLLDYPIAFAAMGFAGLFPKHHIIGALLAGSIRLFCHTLAGVVFFAAYAPIGQNIWLYSFIYNATFLIPSLGLSTFVAWVLWKK